MTESTPVNNPSWKIWPVAFGAVVTVIVTVSVLSWLGWLSIPKTVQQAMVHDMGSQVMPFDLSLTTHIFEMTESGGIQQVIADDPNNSAQIGLIQQHIRHEAMRFSQGDFSDPTSLHGDDMPGVQDLAAGAAQITVEYTALPNGAQITFTTQDLPLITAIHRWFGAQLSDHGSDATYR
ncbi:MAG TPA: hypothetical protein VIH14_07770 [Anaerolineales bacterium]